MVDPSDLIREQQSKTLNHENNDLWEMYRTTDFQVSTPTGELSIRVGELSPKLELLLSERGAELWAFVTAQNPASQLLESGANAMLHERLRTEIAQRSYLAFAGRGVGSDPEWPPEESLLILGINREDAIEIGRKYGQNAVVCGHLGQPAELVDCRPPDKI